MITPLHNHSDFSNLDGNAQPVEIAARCAQIGAPACAITDHGVITGHLDFAKEMKRVGVKPIFGIEAYHGTKWEGFKGAERDQAHLILLAQNDQGLRNLWRIVDDSARPERFRWVPRASWESMERHKDGIIATSACALGLVTKNLLQDNYEPLNRYLDIFGDNFYIELHTYECTSKFEDAGMTQAEVNQMLVQVGTERGIPFVYANDAHYAFPEQYEFHDAYLAAGVKKKGADESIYTDPEERSMWHPQCLYIMDEEDVRQRLDYLPDNIVDEAIDNSMAIAESCTAELPEVRRHLPVFVPKDCPHDETKGYDDASLLFIDLVEAGINKRYPDADEAVWDRAMREMEVFLEAGLEHYFLMAWDVCVYCDQEHILRGPGRGSAAGCIVAYALGITDVDPLHYNLIFERFWNAGRAGGFPDIDSDFARERRQDVISYLTERWGRENVRPIGTTARMKPKAVIDRMRGACAMTYGEADELKKIVNTVPKINILGPDSIAWARESDPDYIYKDDERTIYVTDHVQDEIDKWIGKDEKRAKYVRVCAWLTNRVENYGIHPSGIVISDVPLYDELPCDIRGNKENRKAVTAFVMDDVDKRQFIKLDILGLKTLDTLWDWMQQVADLLGPDFDWSGLDKLDYPDEMWQMLHEGKTAGIFQIEGGFAKQLCQDFKPISVEDISILVALNRPGPMAAAPSFVVRRNGGEDEEFDGRKVPMLSAILEPTYGWFLYQEQVIAYFTALGYDLSDADAVRKILGKKKPEAMANLHEGRGEWEGKGYKDVAYPQLGEETAEEIWEVLEAFALYSFNKSHSVAYAIIAFRCLLMKYYATPEAYAAMIYTVESGKKAEHIPAYINEAKRESIQTFPPDILSAITRVAVREGNIYFGFENVKGVASGGNVIEALRDAGMDISTPEKLMELLEEDSKQLSKEKREAKKNGLPIPLRKSFKQRLNAGKIQALLDAGAWDSLGERNVSLGEKQKMEKATMEVVLTDRSDEIFEENYEQIADCDDYREVNDTPYEGEKLRWWVPGTVVHIKDVRSRAGKQPMGIITIDYKGDTLEFATSPVSWKSHRFLWKDRQCAIFKLARTERGLVFEDGKRLS